MSLTPPSLTPELLAALENLERKKAGKDVSWINIAQARALTDLGLAERTGSGWVISAAGVAALAAYRTDEARDGADPIPFDGGR